jgi:hypothetical protein
MYEHLREHCPMWDTLSRADIDAARQQLQSRREEMLRRHAEELGAVERNQVEIEKLDQLISAFSKKFAPAASGKNELNAQTTAPPGVSLLITQAQRSQLRELGFADDRIRSMTPTEAHQILGIAS